MTVTALVLAAALAGGPAADRILSDRDVIAADRQPFDKAKMMGKRRRLGLHRGVPVIADYRCSDLCPAYTMRVVRYDVQAGAACDAVGGSTKVVMVPIGIAVAPERFCVPAPIATAAAAAKR